MEKSFESELNAGEVIYWEGTAKKPGIFSKKSNCAVTSERVMLSGKIRAESFPYSMIEDENYVPPQVETEEDIMNLREFCTVRLENGCVVFRGVDGEELFRINSDGAEKAFELIKNFCSEQNDI